MTAAQAAAQDIATDPPPRPPSAIASGRARKDPTPFWNLPQPKPQQVLSGLQNQTPCRHVGRYDDRTDDHQDGLR